MSTSTRLLLDQIYASSTPVRPGFAGVMGARGQRLKLYSGAVVIGVSIFLAKDFASTKLGLQGSVAEAIAMAVVFAIIVMLCELWFRVGPGAQMAAEERSKLQQFEGLVLQSQYPILITELGTMTGEYPRIVFVNAAMEQLSGYAADELVGRTPRLLQGPGTDPAALASIREAVANGQRFLVEVLNYGKGGAPYWVQIDGCPIVNDLGQVTHYIAIEANVTDRNKDKDELLQARATAETALVAHRNLLAVASHELRTPLHQLIGYFQLAATEPDETARQEFAISGLDAGHRLAHLIDDVLEVARQDLSDDELMESSQCLRELATHTAHDLRSIAQQRSIMVEIAGQELIAEIDYSKMRRVMISLIRSMLDRVMSGSTLTISIDRSAAGNGIVEISAPVGEVARGAEPAKASRGPTSYAIGDGDSLLGVHLAQVLLQRHGGCVEQPSRSVIRLIIPAERIQPELATV